MIRCQTDSGIKFSGNLGVNRFGFRPKTDNPDNLCQCPHWGTVVKGSIHVTYADGTEETVNAGEVYYWPSGHTVRVDEDYEAIEFSPSDQMSELMSHLEAKLKG